MDLSSLPADRSDDDDTAARSLAHWSEAGRSEMEAFYAFASLDYELLARALPWDATLTAVRDRRSLGAGTPLRLLDVACGSGKFPAALLAGARLRDHLEAGIDYALLDPSAFSIAEAAGVLAPPFVRGSAYETTLEALDPSAGPWDVVWATHALYALRPDRLQQAADRFVAAIAPGGLGFLAQGAGGGHYLRVYEAFLRGVRGSGTPYLGGEQVADALERAGAARDLRVHRHHLHYEHRVPLDDLGLLEGYLQRCLFDDTLGLDEMLVAPQLGTYLAGCRDEQAGVYRFAQDVLCATVLPEGVPSPWTAAS
ncbi:methyltransferase domain-containing protein [Conexibacter sp. W3-3-2]|uniref:class I SAM-dependent methyltransferase n=1 Tax=Conexibacter sp. W3-3-2 TaxID=2675227 RepID=UPI0012B74761|nr:class I SAM-dependent methyltransferase [Conexibacter sp. W3-3-2]MTD44286.1 methyltransferase domain-containing protein [Conexibacter sp. W3-3-2]